MARSMSSVVAALFVLACVSALALQQSERGTPPRFRVSVEVVRIDAVVTDRDGRIVPDLTADDFEVLQNGKLQQVTFAQFVPVVSSARPVQGDDVENAPADVPVRQSRPVRRESIQRTLAIVVDDLGLSWESMHQAKRALHTFVDRDVGASDLVAIVRTGGSIGGLQPFTTDRRLLHGTIDRLAWNGLSRSAVEPYEALNEWTTFDERHGMGDLSDFKLVNTLRRSISAAGTLGALNLAIEAARDLPGRKAILFVSEGFEMLEGGEPDTRVRAALDHAIDRAARAGVVVYSLDARGLQTAGLQASDNLKRPMPGETLEATVRQRAAGRLEFNRNTQEALAYLAEQTGGFAILNNNDLARGLGRISDDIRDYYVIGYVPDEGTFARKGQKPRYQKISVRARRPGLRVRTRKEFLGVSDLDEPSAPSPAQQLVRAAISPFTETEIELRATTLPGYSPDQGLFVRALLHIDARALTFGHGEAGKNTASADVLGMVFDRDGTQVAHLTTGFVVGLTDASSTEALRDGLVYTLRIPIPRAGAYQVRFAVRDRQSGRMGSAGEFTEVADARHGEFALSGIVLQGDNGPSQAGAKSEAIALSPSQALRIYAPGTGLSYAYEVYNAGQEVYAAPSVWRGAEKIMSAPPNRLIPPAGDARRFAARGRLKLGDALPRGSYMLQLTAATPDPKHRGRLRSTIQRITFEVR
jgi:VWFA-related protein